MGCCQTNANLSLRGMNVVNLCSTKLTPFGQRYGAVNSAGDEHLPGMYVNVTAVYVHATG